MSGRGAVAKFNEFRSTCAAKLRAEVKVELADEIKKKKGKDAQTKFIENEVNKRVRVAMRAAPGNAGGEGSATSRAATAADGVGAGGVVPETLPSSAAAAELTHKDVGYLDHGLTVFKSLTRAKFRAEVRADAPELKAQGVDQRVAAMARAEWKKLSGKQQLVLEFAPKTVKKTAGATGMFESDQAAVASYLRGTELEYLLGDLPGVVADGVGAAGVGCDPLAGGSGVAESEADPLTPAKSTCQASPRSVDTLRYSLLGSSGGARASRKSRQRDLRAALDEAKGAGGTADDLVQILETILSPDEWDAIRKRSMQNATAEDVAANAWAGFGQACAKLLVEHTRHKWRWPMVLAAVCAKRIGCSSRKRVPQLFGFKPSRAVWELADSEGQALQDYRPSTGNGRVGFRKLRPEVISNVLEVNSSDTCRFGVKSGRLSEDSAQQPYAIRSLSSTPAAIHRSTDDLVASVSQRTFSRYVKQDHPQYRTTARKLDCCEKCLSWDTRVVVLMRRSLLAIAPPLAELWPSYFDRWLEQWPDVAAPAFEVSSASLVALREYIQEHADWDGRASGPVAGLNSAKRIELHEAEANALKQLDLHWDMIKDEDEDDEEDGNQSTKLTMVSVAQWYGWHFTCRDHQKAAYKEACSRPAPGYLGLHVDFGQSRTLPVGPKEGGRWWYANARMSVNVFVAYLWGDGVEVPGYYVYLSDVLDHTPEYAIACLDDLLGKVFTSTVTDVALWADVGTHFRAARMWGYWLDTMPVAKQVNAQANYFPDGHGKEKIDGHIGRTGKWISRAAKKKVISTHENLQEALQTIADEHNAQNVGRSQCHYIHFNPPPVASLPGKKMSPAMLADAKCAVKSTFAMSAVLSPDGGRVALRNHTLTGLDHVASIAPRYDDSMAKGKGRRRPRARAPDDDEDDDAPVADGEVGPDGWRRTYRKHRPEKAPPSWKYLAQCYRSQKRACVALAPRRQPLAVRRDGKLKSLAAEKARRRHA